MLGEQNGIFNIRNIYRLYIPDNKKQVINITKEQFVKRIQLIQNFHSEQETLGVLIDKITDGYPTVTIGDYLITEMIDMIEENLGHKDILEWWLYEDVEKIIYNLDNTVFADVTKIEDLYDYMTNNN